jgi:hypothetical protein
MLSSVFRVGKDIFQRNGISHGLFKGFSLNILKAPLAAGVSFMIRDILDTRFIQQK